MAPGSKATPPLSASAVWDAVVKALTKSDRRKASKDDNRLPDYAKTVFDPDSRIPMEAVATPDLALWPPGHLGYGR